MVNAWGEGEERGDVEYKYGCVCVFCPACDDDDVTPSVV